MDYLYGKLNETLRYYNQIDDSIVSSEKTWSSNKIEEYVNMKVSSTNRPELPVIGQNYFDIALGKPIWFSGSIWVDANGDEV